MEDLISVIVPIYNAEQVLCRTLECISQQTYGNLEIILVDDGSTDSSSRICDAFAEKDPRCKVIHKSNGGQGSAKNAGQKIATGAFLFFPDSDDTFNLDMIRLLHEAILMDPSYDFAFSKFKVVDNRDTDTDTSPSNCAIIEDIIIDYSRDELIEGLFGKSDDRFVYGWNKLYKKELLDNLWCEDYPRHQDFDFNYKVFLRTNKAVFVNQELYHWVQWRGSKTHQPNTWDLFFKSRVTILYDNWVHIAPENRKYEHYLLGALYGTMVFWEEWSRKSGNSLEVKDICDDYCNKTMIPFVRVKGVALYKKVACLLFLAFPEFAHLMMKLTSNAR